MTIEANLERIAAALETLATLALAQTPQNPVVKVAAPLPPLPGTPIEGVPVSGVVTGAPPAKRGRPKKVEAAPSGDLANVVTAVDSAKIKLEGDDAEDDFLKAKGNGAAPPAKKLEVADVRAELVKIQTNTAAGGNARIVLGLLKSKFNVDTLAQLKPDQFQAVIEAARAAPEYPKGA